MTAPVAALFWPPLIFEQPVKATEESNAAKDKQARLLENMVFMTRPFHNKRRKTPAV
jgi:hypothetical protein